MNTPFGLSTLRSMTWPFAACLRPATGCIQRGASHDEGLGGPARRADFAGSAERLEAIAGDLQPGWIAFVGKEAYRGAFNERPELGVQPRRLAGAGLFVLPSTSPANAAVPWEERLRWFRKLSAEVSRASGS